MVYGTQKNYMVYIYIYTSILNGIYKPTYNWTAPPCRLKSLESPKMPGFPTP